MSSLSPVKLRRTPEISALALTAWVRGELETHAPAYVQTADFLLDHLDSATIHQP
jgi:hypothetical protein